MKKVLLMLLGVLIALPGITRDFSYEYEGQTLTYTVLDEEAKTCKTKRGSMWGDAPGNKVYGDLKIPSVAKDGDVEYFVTEIAENAFYGYSGPTSVTIPDGVTSIGNSAFLKCSSLTSVIIPGSVTSIGSNAFKGCNGLTSVNIPDGVTMIQNSVFEGCSSLTSIDIPDGVTSIDSNAFCGCTGLTSVNIPNSVTNIGNDAFNGCSSLKTFTVEDGSTTLSFGNDALKNAPIETLNMGRNWSFWGNVAISTSIKNVNIGNQVTALPNNAFRSCSDLTSVIIPNSVTEIGSSAFQDCSDLKTFTVEDGSTTLSFGNDALKNAPIETLNMGRNWTYSVDDAISKGIKSVTLGSQVTALPDYAFHDCSGLTSIDIPDGVTSIGKSIFSGCTDLTSIDIPDGVTSIGSNAFCGCTDLTSIDIPDGVTSIGDEAFDNCSGLTSVIIPASVTSIGSWAFDNCSGLTSVIIPASVTSIGSRAFYNCSGLKKSAYPSGLSNPFEDGFAILYPREGSIIEDGCIYGPEKKSILFAPLTLEGEFTIPNTVTEIGKNAFRACSGLKTFTVEDGSTTLTFGESALDGAPIETLYMGRNWTYSEDGAISTGIKSVTLGSQVTALPNSAFKDCSGLTSVIIPASVTSIGENAFLYCRGLKTFTVEDGSTTLSFGSDALQYAPIETLNMGRNWTYSSKAAISTGIESVTLGNQVTALPDYAFRDCSGLTSINIPDFITSIGYAAFYNCSKLTEVNIPDSVTEIADYTFYGCRGLTSVIIPDGITSIGYAAFYNCSGLTSVIILGPVNSVGQYAFDGCKGLIKSAYPSNLRNPFSKGLTVAFNPEGAIIEDGWIYGPEKKSILFAPYTLKGEFTIPNSVTEIGAHAFLGCSGLTAVNSLQEVPPTMADNSFEGLYATAKLSIPDAAVEDYLATNWSLFENLNFGTSGKEISTYSDGVLKYRLIPAATEGENNLAVVISGDYSSLTEVSIPYRFTVEAEGADPVRYYVDGIGYNAFKDCSGLTSVSFHSRNTSKVIGDYAFAGSGINALTIPETVEAIGDYAFNRCSSLASIIIPGSVKTLGNYAFNECSKLQTVEMSKGLGTIGNYAFNNCSSLAEIAIPGSVKTLGNYAFNGCSKLQTVEMSKGLGTIGNYAFNNCSSLTEIAIPGSVKTLGDYAFYGTSEMKKVTLNEGLESIGEKAFSCNYDRNKEPLYIPSTLKSVGKDAFYNFNCEYVNIKDLAAWCNIDFADVYSNPADRGLYLNGEKIENLVIPETVTEVKNYAFCYISSLKSVTFPDALQRIGDGAFKEIDNITTITIPGSVTEIGAEAFTASQPELTFAYGAAPIAMAENSFGAPKTLFWDRSMDDYNLKLSSLETLTIGNSVAEIPAAKFKGTSRLTTLTLGSSLTAIGDEAFSGCTSLKEVIVPPSVEAIGASAFAGNSKMTSIIMGHSVKTIGEKAFDGCPAQTVSITAQTPPTAPNNAFSNYTGKLYVQGDKAVDAYLDAYTCWDRFDGAVMIEASGIDMGDSPTTITGKAGDTFQLTATLMPENVTLPQVFWRSTNPEIATVTPDGVVTLKMDLSDIQTMALDGDSTDNTCKIIAESLYANGPVVEVGVNVEPSGIDDIVVGDGEIDFNAPVEVYNLQGVMVGESMDGLAHGIYIVRQGSTVKKIAVR